MFESNAEEQPALRADDQDHPVSGSTWNSPDRFYRTDSGMFHVEQREGWGARLPGTGYFFLADAGI